MIDAIEVLRADSPECKARLRRVYFDELIDGD